MPAILRSTTRVGPASAAPRIRKAHRTIRARFQPLRIPLQDLACAALFAFFAMQGSIPGIAPAAALEMTGSAPTTLTTTGGILTQALASAVIVGLLLRHPRLLLRHLASLPWLALLAILAIASTAWSLEPLLTLRRSILFALAGLYGLWFAARYPLPRQLAILRLALLATALASIAIVVLVPSIGLDHSPGHAADWQGIFTQKNACGRIMVLATAAVLFAERLTPARLASLALFLFILVMSGSRGAWLIEVAVLLLWLLVVVTRRASPRVRLILGIAAPAAAAALALTAALLFTPVMHALGRDPTLTGRTAIWAHVLHFIALRPLSGFGYAAFWRGMTGPSLQISSAIHFIVLHAHNGFLEIALELGLPGLVLFLLSWIRAARQLWSLWRRGPLAALAWPLAILVLIFLYDLDENTLLIYNGLFWVLYAAALTTIEKASRDSHHTCTRRSRAMLTLSSLAPTLRFRKPKRAPEISPPTVRLEL